MFPKYSKDILLVAQELRVQLHSSGQPPWERCRRSPEGLLKRQLHFSFHLLPKLSSKSNLSRLWEDGINLRHTTASHHHTPSQGWARITVGSTQRCLQHLYINWNLDIWIPLGLSLTIYPHWAIRAPWLLESTVRQIHIILHTCLISLILAMKCQCKIGAW